MNGLLFAREKKKTDFFLLTFSPEFMVGICETNLAIFRSDSEWQKAEWEQAQQKWWKKMKYRMRISSHDPSQ